MRITSWFRKHLRVWARVQKLYWWRRKLEGVHLDGSPSGTVGEIPGRFWCQLGFRVNVDPHDFGHQGMIVIGLFFLTIFVEWAFDRSGTAFAPGPDACCGVHPPTEHVEKEVVGVFGGMAAELKGEEILKVYDGPDGNDMILHLFGGLLWSGRMSLEDVRAYMERELADPEDLERWLKRAVAAGERVGLVAEHPLGMAALADMGLTLWGKAEEAKQRAEEGKPSAWREREGEGWKDGDEE